MIAVDWGTSNLRLYRLDEHGAVLERRRSECGVLASQDRFASVLAQETDGWDDADIVMSGMIGSRNGWHEVPYLDCPAGLAELSGAMQRMSPEAFRSRRLWWVPGMCDRQAAVPDVMRGEETQVAALLDVLPGGSHVICLPGTHSKWVTVRDARITSIATAMTGELFAVLRQHSILGKLMSLDDARFDAAAFDAGLRRSGEGGGWLHHLFGVRTTGLFRQFSDTSLSSYLSGILIGHEIRASELFSRVPRPALVHLIGSDRLLTAYAHALTALGIGVQRHSEHLAAVGMAKLFAMRRQK